MKSNFLSYTFQYFHKNLWVSEQLILDGCDATIRDC